MKRFRTISTLFIVVISLIFCCNVYYLATLYRSIRGNMERDVMTAISDADLDELWIRADRARAQMVTALQADSVTEDPSRHGEISVGKTGGGNMISTTRHADGHVTTRSDTMNTQYSLTNKLVDEVGKQFHVVMDPYIPMDPAVMDSVLLRRLGDRFIYPDYIASEIVDSMGRIVTPGQGRRSGAQDMFTYCFNPEAGLSYHIYMTPLTRHILSRMAGVTVTVFLLMVTFALAFIYLFRTVSRLRTIEEMKDDFVSNMTHELKTPIAIAYSANDALLNYDTDNDRAKKTTYLKIANKQLRLLGELVENILAMSMERRKAMTLKYETIMLLPLVEEIAAAQRMRVDKSIEINVDIAEDVAVEADRSHLANVLNNLIDNAIKYSGEAVCITVRGDRAGLSVADDGIGIPPKAIPYLFNRFYRVPSGNRQDVRGYGIGLYYVKSILDRMGWGISVDSTPGKGSTFTIKFRKDEI